MKIFTPLDIKGMADSAVREAYASLRGVAQKRVGRMAAQGLGRDLPTFPTTRGLSNEEARQQLAEVSRWIRDPRHTVKGYKRQRAYNLERFHEKGYDWIDESNYEDFIRYMEELREEYGSKVFDSGDAVDVYNNAQRIGIPTDTIKKNFNYFAQHLEDLDRMRPVRSEKGATMGAIRDKIRKLSN